MDEPICNSYLPSTYCKLPVSLSQRLYNAVEDDQKDEFVRLIKDPGFEQEFDTFTDAIFNYDALNIAIAVFNEETKGIVDPEDILDDEITPLQLAAALGSRKLIKYFLERGDDVDVLCDYEIMNLKQATLVDLTVESITFCGRSRAWTHGKSIFELLVHVCRRKYGLEALRLLVQNTKNKERVRQAFIDYADKGQFVQLTALFLAAPELFLSSDSGSLQGRLSPFGMLDFVLTSLEKKSEMEKGLSQLLDVFSMVGDKLVAYVRLEDPSILEFTSYQVNTIIGFFLREVAHKKLGVSSRDDYFLRFFKPVRLEADLVSSSPSNMTKWQNDIELKEDEPPIVFFDIKRKDGNIDHINRKVPCLEPKNAGLLYRAIEKVIINVNVTRPF